MHTNGAQCAKFCILSDALGRVILQKPKIHGEIDGFRGLSYSSLFGDLRALTLSEHS